MKLNSSFRASSYSSVSFGSPAVCEAVSPPSDQIIKGAYLHPRKLGSCDSTRKLCFAPRAKTVDSNKMKMGKENDRFFNNPLFGRLLTAIPPLKINLNENQNNEISFSVIEEGILDSLIRLNQIFEIVPNLASFECDNNVDNVKDTGETLCFYNSFHVLNSFNNISEISHSTNRIIYRLKCRHDHQWYCIKTGINYNEVNKFQNLSPSNLEILREIKILSTLNHRNIVNYHKCWIEQQCIFLQLEYLIGESLYYFMYSTNTTNENLFGNNFLLKEHFPLTNKVSTAAGKEIIKQISKALNYLHNDIGIIHNDIQPLNIMITCSLNDLDNAKENLDSMRSLIYQGILSGTHSTNVVFKLIGFSKSFNVGETLVQHDSVYMPSFDDIKSRDSYGLAMSIIHALCGHDKFFPDDIRKNGIGDNLPDDKELRDILTKMMLGTLL